MTETATLHHLNCAKNNNPNADCHCGWQTATLTCDNCDKECLLLTEGGIDKCCNCREASEICYLCQNVNEAAYVHATEPAYGNGDR